MGEGLVWWMVPSCTYAEYPQWVSKIAYENWRSCRAWGYKAIFVVALPSFGGGVDECTRVWRLHAWGSHMRWSWYRAFLWRVW